MARSSVMARQVQELPNRINWENSVTQGENGSKARGVRVIHDRVAGRVRFRHPGLVALPERVHSVEATLAGRRGVFSARASGLTGSVLVEYSPPATISELGSVIEAVVAAEPAPYAEKAPEPPPALSASVALEPVVASHAWHCLTLSDAADRLRTGLSDGLAEAETASRVMRSSRCR